MRISIGADHRGVPLKQQLVPWLKSQGLTVDGFSRGRTQVFFSGTAAQVESAFHTQFNRYLVNGETSFANAVEISGRQRKPMLLGQEVFDGFQVLLVDFFTAFGRQIGVEDFARVGFCRERCRALPREEPRYKLGSIF